MCFKAAAAPTKAELMFDDANTAINNTNSKHVSIRETHYVTRELTVWIPAVKTRLMNDATGNTDQPSQKKLSKHKEHCGLAGSIPHWTGVNQWVAEIHTCPCVNKTINQTPDDGWSCHADDERLFSVVGFDFISIPLLGKMFIRWSYDSRGQVVFLELKNYRICIPTLLLSLQTGSQTDSWFEVWNQKVNNSCCSGCSECKKAVHVENDNCTDMTAVSAPTLTLCKQWRLQLLQLLQQIIERCIVTTWNVKKNQKDTGSPTVDANTLYTLICVWY